MPRDRFEDEGQPGAGPDDPEPTARPTAGEAAELAEEAEEKLVPIENVGGAAPTPLGMDSGGDLPGRGDELENLPEPEPPEPPETSAIHVQRRVPPGGRKPG